MTNHQRKGAESNSHVGREFEESAQKYFEKQGISLKSDYPLFIGYGKGKKHNFDLGAETPKKYIVECKSHTWTEGNKVPSAKITTWNQEMYYFSLIDRKEGYTKILFVKRDKRKTQNKETLAGYYIRNRGHLIPPDVEIWEYDEKSREVKKYPSPNLDT